jgi:flavin reductase (DIM6/NTAB) family NADH-FMN oxidoreductase RutF
VSAPLPQTSAAFARVATNVAIVTVARSTDLHGCTANTWAEAPEPPLLLVTLKRNGETGARIATERRFAVNVLAVGQEALAKQFARRGDRFAGVRHHPGDALGQPLLPGTVVGLECELQAIHDFGSQEIFVGLVRGTVLNPKAPAPLLFYDRAFHAGVGSGAR